MIRSTLLTVAALACLVGPIHAQFGGLRPPKLPDLKPPKLPDLKPPKIENPLERARKELEAASARATRELRKLSPQEILGGVRRSLDQRLAKAEASAGVKMNRQTGEMDLRNSKIGRKLGEWLEKFAQGNESKGEVEVLTYNVKSQVLHAQLMARHRQKQNWGVLGKVTLYEVTQRAKFTFDFNRKQASFDIDLGRLAPRINSRSIEALSKGDLVAAAEAAAPDLSAVIRYERKNDYDAVLKRYQDRHGVGRVYLSSRDFVTWAGSRSIGKYAATGVISGGTAVWPQIMKDAQEMAQKELPTIAQWLERLGHRDGQAMARELISGRTPRWPYIKFEMVVIPHYAREVNPQTGVKTPWRRFNNLGFVIVVEPTLRK